MKKVSERLENLVLKDRGMLSNRKIAFFLLFMNIITSASVSIYIPCLKQMAIDLRTTNEMMQMTIVVHLIGEFCGRILCGPLINFRGVKPIVLPALMLSAIGHFGCFLAVSLPFFVCMRFVQALGASVVYVASLSIIYDLFSEKEKAGVVGILELYQPIAWIFSPLAGAIFTELGNWRISFIILSIAQLVGLLFFSVCPDKKDRLQMFSVGDLIRDYRSVLKNSYFVIYSLIPGLFAGGYMIFATSCPFVCSDVIGNDSADIALFSAIPLLFYIAATFVYRSIVKKFGVGLSKWIGTGIYISFGFYVAYLSYYHANWNAWHLLSLVCIQCIGSAFLVPVSIFKALQSASRTASVGASTVVVFRNIIMSLCISISAKFTGNIVTIMACIFMTVATVLMLISTRRIIKIRGKRKLKNPTVSKER